MSGEWHGGKKGRGFRDEDYKPPRISPHEEEWVEFTVDMVYAESAKAILCDIGGEEYWIPKERHISEDSEVYAKGHEGKIIISKWIAEQKGLL